MSVPTSFFGRAAFVSALVVGTAVLFWPVGQYDFINLDDNRYVTDNIRVQSGITWETVTWALTSAEVCNWHPLTWISHMADIEMFALDAGWHHRTNLFLHCLNASVLFLLLTSMTGAFWRSGAVAVLFAIHPLHVESVAWVSERKDVLSTLFYFLAMGAYLRYVKRPRISGYLPVVVFFILGLMSKPMLVSLPFVLLLIDYWPLGRMAPAAPVPDRSNRAVSMSQLRRLLVEKIPLLAIAAIASVVTLWVQREGNCVKTFVSYPFGVRVSNAAVSYIKYLVNTFWPVNLAVYYPHSRGEDPGWQVAGASLLLVCLTVAAIAAVRYRYLLVGWFWYLGTMVPVIGLVQVGGQAMADRYTYIPLTGVFLALVWGAGDLLWRTRYGRMVLAGISLLVIPFLLAGTRLQITTWKNSISLFTRALEATGENALAYNNLGDAYFDVGEYGLAARHFAAAIEVNPFYETLRPDYGLALYKSGNLREARVQLDAALRMYPENLKAHNTMGMVVAEMGELEQAEHHFRRVLQLQPDNVDALNNLGVVAARKGQMDEAFKLYGRALALDPRDTNALFNIGVFHYRQERYDDAASYFSRVLQIDRGRVAARDYLEMAKAKIKARSGK